MIQWINGSIAVSHGHKDVAVIREGTPRPGHAVNLHAMPCRDDSQPSRRALAGAKSRGHSCQVRAACHLNRPITGDRVRLVLRVGVTPSRDALGNPEFWLRLTEPGPLWAPPGVFFALLVFRFVYCWHYQGAREPRQFGGGWDRSSPISATLERRTQCSPVIYAEV